MVEYETIAGEAFDAFERAIKEGRLSDNQKADNYAGFYMFMGSKDGRDMFKNTRTRLYDV